MIQAWVLISCALGFLALGFGIGYAIGSWKEAAKK